VGVREGVPEGVLPDPEPDFEGLVVFDVAVVGSFVTLGAWVVDAAVVGAVVVLDDDEAVRHPIIIMIIIVII